MKSHRKGQVPLKCRLLVATGCLLFCHAAKTALLGQCTPGTKPTNINLIEVVPNRIQEGSGNTPFVLRFTLTNGSIDTTPGTINLDAFLIRWDGLLNGSGAPSSVTGPDNSVYSLRFLAAAVLMTPAQTVILSFSTTFCGGGAQPTVTSGGSSLLVVNPAPAITSLTPSVIQAGSSALQVAVDGTGFNNTSRVRFNGSERPTVLSTTTRLQASIAAADVASAGFALVTVVNPEPGGGASNALRLDIQPPPVPDLFIPIVLSSSGKNNSFYTSELTLTNRSSQNASLNFRYTANFGDGGGSATDALPAGQQRIIPDAIAYLRSIGIAIPESGNRGGTLSIRFDGVTNPVEGAATVRTTTAVAGGSAGLAYAGIPVAAALTGRAYLCGLRQNATDRSNVALQNAGAPGSGDVVLRVTIFSGNPGQPIQQTLPDFTLSPGGFAQIGETLNLASLAEGFVRVERLSGTAPYYSYAVINDENTSDGSFVPPVLEGAMAGRVGITVPAMVEAGPFTSELVVANWSGSAKTLRCSYVAQGIQNPSSSANFFVTIGPGEQRIIGNFVQFLRDIGVAGLPVGTSGGFSGALFATVDSGDMNGVFLGARTSSPSAGGRFGVFYAGVPYGVASQTSAWLYGLQQNGNSRTNLAVINTGETSTDADTFSIEFFNGETGTRVSTLSGITRGFRQWDQIGLVLANHAPGVQQGYAKVTRTGGSNPFIAYAVINDGGQPGQRTGDGAYVPSSP